jgi:hypothetical protein
MNYRLRIILTAYHELKKTNRHVTQSMVAHHTGIPKRTIEAWVNDYRHEGRRFALDTDIALNRQKVINYVREHCGTKARLTLFELHMACGASRITLANMIREGYLRRSKISKKYSALCNRGKESHFFAVKDIETVELPTDFEPMTAAEFNEAANPWHLPATFERSIRGKKNDVRPAKETRPRKATAEMEENDEQDDTTLAVYYALSRPSPYPTGSDQVFHGWTVKEIVAASGRCDSTVRCVLKYLLSGEGALCLISKTVVDGVAHYKQRLIYESVSEKYEPGIRIMPGLREHDRRAA